EIAMKAQDLLDIRSAPTVDRLVIVADHANIPVFTADESDDFVLGMIRVLILVDQNVSVALLVVGPNRLVIAEEAHGLEEEIIKVQRMGPGQKVLIPFPDRAHELILAIRSAF